MKMLRFCGNVGFSSENVVVSSQNVEILRKC